MRELRVLVADDDDATRALVCEILKTNGFAVEGAADGPSALAALHDGFDLALLDVEMPGMSGLDVLDEARRTDALPVIMLTAHAREDDRVAGLERGADDYIVKPFSVRELVARVHAVLRRTADERTPAMAFGMLEIDRAARTVRRDGAEVGLTPREFDLLAFLAAHPGQAFTREELLVHVWRSSAAWQDRETVTEHVRRLRRKLEPDYSQPLWIKTVRGGGYLFDG